MVHSEAKVIRTLMIEPVHAVVGVGDEVSDAVFHNVLGPVSSPTTHVDSLVHSTIWATLPG